MKGHNRYLKSFEKTETKREYKDRKMEEKQQEWKDKALHGQYTKIADRTDTKKTYKWIKNGYMKKETEGLLMAAHDQALPTRNEEVQHRVQK